MTHSHDVLCAGEALVMVTPNDGGRLDARSTFILRPGGSEPNVASLMYRASLWPVTKAATELLTLAQASDIVFVGRDEAEALWGTRTADEVRDLIDKPAHLVVKDSDIEAVSYLDDTSTRVPSPTVQVVEAVGAGDAFAAGWLSGFLRQKDGTTRLRLSHLVTAHVRQSPTDSAELPGRSIIEKIVSIDPTEWNTSMTHVPVTGAKR